MRYFKQYGTRRSGTNFLRALLEQNFSNTTVLMHTLGGKHNPPVNLKIFSAQFQNDSFAFVEAATAAEPAENCLPFSSEQRQYMMDHAKAIQDSVRNKTLHFLISVKEPYAWINSMFKYWLNDKNENDPEVIDEFCKLVSIQCAEYNAAYRSYLELFQKYPQQTTIVHYHNLIKNPFGFLNGLKSRLSLEKSSETYFSPKKIIHPTDWDQQQSHLRLAKKDFDPDYYLQRKYLQSMRPEVIDCISKSIDWNLMAFYGYEKINSVSCYKTKPTINAAI